MRTILHVDIDAFYASVEELDDPSIIGKPVAVGGRSEHGIVTTANYEARKYGIHSAMPMFMAKNLCDNLTVKPMRRARYLEKSKEVFDILKTFTDKIEKVSIDESYLDVTGMGYDKNIAKKLQDKVYKETGLNVSVGLSYNKFLAKLASDWNKPKGIKVITPDDVPDILLPLDISKVHGIGKKSENKLKSLGINTVEDLYELPESFLVELFKKKGTEIYDRIRGIDNRKVEVDVLRKSLGTETTFEITSSRETLKNHLKDFAEEISEELIYKEISGYTLTLKLKNENFVIKTRSKTYISPIYRDDDIYKKGVDIFNEVYNGEKIRLIGLTVSNLENINIRQLKFLAWWGKKMEQEKLIDRVNNDDYARANNFKVVSFEGDNLVMEMDPDKQHINAIGIVRGGALYSLMDSAAGFMLALKNKTSVTVDSSVNFISSTKIHEKLYSKTRILHSGRTINVVDVEVYNKDEKLISHGTFTMFNKGDKIRKLEK